MHLNVRTAAPIFEIDLIEHTLTLPEYKTSASLNSVIGPLKVSPRPLHHTFIKKPNKLFNILTFRTHIVNAGITLQLVLAKTTMK